MKNRELFENLIRLADRIEAEHGIALERANKSADEWQAKFPKQPRDSVYPFVSGWLEGSMSNFARELRALAETCRPKQRRKLAAVGILIALLAGCATDDDKPDPLPTCDEIGAPPTLFCNVGGVCSWEGMQCCIAPALGAKADARCEGAQ